MTALASHKHHHESPSEHKQNLSLVEKSIEQDAQHHSYHKLFEELNQLRKGESKDQFTKDLKQINEKLHNDGFLPGLSIVESKKGDFNLQATGKSNPSDAPQHTTPPAGGFDNTGGNMGGGSSGYGGSSGFGGDVGGDGGSVSSSGSSEGSGLPSSGPVSFNNYDGNDSDMSSDQTAADQEAEQDLGNEMWTHFPAASAEEGCAASVSQVLDNAGVAHLTPGQGDALVSKMQTDLMAQGWTVTDKPQPGDVVCGYGGLSSAHTGIVGKNGMVYDNHSSTGKFSTDHLSYFSNWNKVVFLKPPDHPTTASTGGTTAKHG